MTRSVRLTNDARAYIRRQAEGEFRAGNPVIDISEHEGAKSLFIAAVEFNEFDEKLRRLVEAADALQEECKVFDEDGKLVATTYPRDDSSNHFSQMRKMFGNVEQRWVHVHRKTPLVIQEGEGEDARDVELCNQTMFYFSRGPKFRSPRGNAEGTSCAYTQEELGEAGNALFELTDKLHIKNHRNKKAFNDTRRAFDRLLTSCTTTKQLLEKYPNAVKWFPEWLKAKMNEEPPQRASKKRVDEAVSAEELKQIGASVAKARIYGAKDDSEGSTGSAGF